MNRLKRFITIISITLISMAAIPFIVINTVKADAGMLAALALLFVLNPIVSAIIGIIAGKDIKFFWFSPIVVAAVFWISSFFAYDPAFPVVYAASYFGIALIAMLITAFINKKIKRTVLK